MKPYLKNSTTGTVEKAVTRRLDSSDLDDLLHLQEKITTSLTDPSLFIAKERVAFEIALSHGGAIIGIFSPTELCGSCTITMPGESADNFASDAGISSEERLHCAFIDSLMVSPSYHRNGIARELLSQGIQIAADGNGARYILAAVSPKDTAGIFSLLSINGMRIKSLRQKYGCKLRYILCYAQQDKTLFTRYERFPIQDVYTISKFLADGFEGIATFLEGDQLFIWMAR